MTGGGGGQASLPAKPPQNPGFPDNPYDIVFEGFSTLNTKPTRQGIKDDEMFICDGWMPLGDNNARTVPGLGSALYTYDGTNKVAYFGFCTLPFTSGSVTTVTPVCLATIGTSSAGYGLIQINQQTASVTTLLSVGSIKTATAGSIAFGQWGNQYGIIATNGWTSANPNAYWLWTGSTLFGPGTLSPVVTITSGGLNFTSVPNVSATGGSGSGATFTATIADGSVTDIAVNNPGSGYVVNDKVYLRITDGGGDQVATATVPAATSSGVQSVYVINGGSGYTTKTVITVSGSPAVQPSFAIGAQNGTITSITVLHPGIDVDSGATLSISDSGGGSGAVLQPVIVQGQVGTPVISNGGTNYTSAPLVTVVGDGQGAQVIVTSLSGGVVSGIETVNPGTGYSYVNLIFSGGNNAATAEINLMPFGVGGNSVEMYQGRVWLANGNTIEFTSPGDPSDFDPANGAGAFASTDPYLRYNYVGLKQSNGFLYLLADSSIDYISNVQTSGSPPITTFSKLNVDPQIGVSNPFSSPYSSTLRGLGSTTDAIALFSRNLVFTNRNGIYASYGGAVTKVSTPLDGIYGVASGASGLTIISTAVATIFGVQVFMFIQQMLDQYTGTTVNKLCLWDGKRWFTTDQNWANGATSPIFIAADSAFTAYVTDGQTIKPMFQSATTGFYKTIQSKLWFKPSVFFTKQALQIYEITTVNINDGSTVKTFVDTENQSSEIDWTISTTGNVLQQLKPPANYGQEIGLTIRTTAEDLTLVTVELMTKLQQTRY